MPVVNNLKFYYSRATGTIAPASYFATRPHTDPENFFSMGTFGPTQNPPYLKNGEVFRSLYGKEVKQERITEALKKWLNQ